MIEKAAIIILTQSSEVRRTYLKTTLYFLFRFFNAAYQYPVRILVESDYQERWKEEIRLSVRSQYRHLISFKEIKASCFDTPPFIDSNRLARNLSAMPVPYWRNERYRAMCRFWLTDFFDYVTDLDYYMRLDDDALIEEPIHLDLFQLMVEKGLTYISNMVHIDCPVCCYGMKDFFKSLIVDDLSKQTILETLYHPSHINPSMISNLLDKPLMRSDESVIVAPMPMMYYNNFHVTDLRFWRRPEVVKALHQVDQTGNTFYFRWGDAPIQTMIVHLFGVGKEGTIKFRYSKRLQRESFEDNIGHFHSFMPADYDNTSCVSYKPANGANGAVSEKNTNKVPDVIRL